jgi:hypothetical protein
MSNEPTIAEKNYVIGVFDGRSFVGSHITDYTAATAPKMKYHSSWDWLMPIYHKIREIALLQYEDPEATLLFTKMNNQLLFGTIADVHLRAYHFIEYLNKQQSNEQSAKRG